MLTITSHHPRPLSPAFFHSWQPNNVSWGTPAHVDTLEGMSTCQTPLMIAYCSRWLARIGEVKRRLPAARPRTHWAPVPSGGRSVPSEAAFRLSKAEQPWPWRPLAITNNLQATREQQMGFSRDCCPIETEAGALAVLSDFSLAIRLSQAFIHVFALASLMSTYADDCNWRVQHLYKLSQYSPGLLCRTYGPLCLDCQRLYCLDASET